MEATEETVTPDETVDRAPPPNNDTNNDTEMTIPDLIEIIETIRKAQKGQYYDNILKVANDKEWTNSNVNRTIESTTKEGKIIEKMSNNKVSYRIQKKGVTVTLLRMWKPKHLLICIQRKIKSILWKILFYSRTV